MHLPFSTLPLPQNCNSLTSLFSFRTTMACTRQLFELLEEKQEPFLLDVYLLENGCSSRRLQRMSSQGFKRRGAAVGFLRSIMTKLVHGKPFSKALKWDTTSKPIESRRLSSVFSCFSGLSSREFGGDHQCSCIEMEDSNQLSPVSVLQFLNNRFKEESQSSISSFDSPRESPGILELFPHHTKSNKRRESQGKQLLFDCVMEAEERAFDCHHGCLGAEIRAKLIHERILSWQRLQGDMNSLTKLLGSYMSEFSSEWNQFRPEVRELGVEIESAIFKEIVDEVVLDILGTHCA